MQASKEPITMPAYANRRPSSLESSRRNGDPLAGRGTRLALRACALLVGRVHRSIPEMHDLRLSSGYDGITLGTWVRPGTFR